MHSIRADRPVEPLIVDVLSHISEAARQLGLSYFVAGALARDLMLQHVYGLDIGRATRDVDIGIAVENWDQFEAIKRHLIATKLFSPSKISHRLDYSALGSKFGLPLDIIPFEGVEKNDNTLTWPPELDVVMNIAGFGDAIRTATLVQVGEELAVPVASLPGLALLKIFAWIDRGRETSKDALDLMLLMRKYAEAGNTDRIYSNERELLTSVDFDLDLAGAVLLGRDVAAMTSDDIRMRALQALSSADTKERLINTLVGGTTWTDDEQRIAAAESFLDAFLAGLATPAR
jgi:predicted nucleotidyltransferase